MLSKISVLVAATALALTAGVANAADHNRGHDHVTVGLDLGGIAIGYSDGYWDNSHHWHHWRNKSQMRDYRTHHRSHYHAKSHTHYHNNGWHGH